MLEGCKEGDFFLVCKFSVDLLACGGRDEVFGDLACNRLLGGTVVALDPVLRLTGSEDESGSVYIQYLQLYRTATTFH